LDCQGPGPFASPQGVAHPALSRPDGAQPERPPGAFENTSPRLFGKTRTQHRLLIRYYRSAFQRSRYHSSSRSEWLWNLLIQFPTPRSITCLSRHEFVRKAWNLVGRKVAKQRILTDIYLTAQASVGLPVEENSETVAMLRFVLRQVLTLCRLRATVEKRADDLLSGNKTISDCGAFQRSDRSRT